eukprot:1906428-Rhodomonas_salina.1
MSATEIGDAAASKLRMCYEMSGTEKCYDATSKLRMCYEMSGTEKRYAATSKLRMCYEMSGTEKRYAATSKLRMCYAMSGTEKRYAASRHRQRDRSDARLPRVLLPLSPNACATLCPVLNIVYHASCLYVMPSTDQAAMLLPGRSGTDIGDQDVSVPARLEHERACDTWEAR